MAVTAREVAEHAGVSISTVSRVLSAPHLVAAKTRQRVQAAVEELGYQPNRSAQLLSSGKTKTLGLVVPDLQNPYFAALAKGIQARAWEFGYLVIIADSGEDASQEPGLISSIATQVDGLILASLRSDTNSLNALNGRSNFILVNREMPGVDSISVNNAEAIELLVRHLLALGHTKIAYLGGPAGSWSDTQRRQGLAKAASELPFELIDVGATAPTQSGGFSAADLLVASGASAGICFNDMMAVGVLERLRIRGISVPAEFSIVGIDNIAVGTAVFPTLTSVGVSQQRLGREAADLLLKKITDDGTHRASVTLLPMELAVRGSSGTAPAEGA